jgi:hypothetical protein
MGFDTGWRHRTLSEGLTDSAKYVRVIAADINTARAARDLPPIRNTWHDLGEDSNRRMRSAVGLVKAGRYTEALRRAGRAQSEDMRRLFVENTTDGSQLAVFERSTSLLARIPDEDLDEALSDLWKESGDDLYLSVVVAAWMRERIFVNTNLLEAVGQTIVAKEELLPRRIMGLRLAGSSGRTEFEPYLSRVLSQDEVYKIHHRAVTALGRIGTDSCATRLDHFIRDNSDNAQYIFLGILGLVMIDRPVVAGILEGLAYGVSCESDLNVVAKRAAEIASIFQSSGDKPLLRRYLIIYDNGELHHHLKGRGICYEQAMRGVRGLWLPTKLMDYSFRADIAKLLAELGYLPALGTIRRLARSRRTPGH